jgi:hypothetical protein
LNHRNVLMRVEYPTSASPPSLQIEGTDIVRPPFYINLLSTNTPTFQWSVMDIQDNSITTPLQIPWIRSHLKVPPSPLSLAVSQRSPSSLSDSFSCLPSASEENVTSDTASPSRSCSLFLQSASPSHLITSTHSVSSPRLLTSGQESPLIKFASSEETNSFPSPSPLPLSRSLSSAVPYDRVNRLATVGTKFRVELKKETSISQLEKESVAPIDPKEVRNHDSSPRSGRESDRKTLRSQDSSRRLSKNSLLTKSRRSVQSITKRGEKTKEEKEKEEKVDEGAKPLEDQKLKANMMGSGQKVRDSDSVIMWFQSGFHVTIRDGDKIYPCICVAIVNKSWDNISNGESLGLFFSHSAFEIAQFISHYQHSIYSSIHPREIFMWTHTKRKERDCPSMYALVSHFNRLASWAVHGVVTRIKKKERVMVLSKIVEACRFCFEMNNFLAVQAFVSAYHHSAIVRMKKTLTLIGPLAKEMAQFSDVMSHVGNFSAYRTKLAGAKPPRIPYVG